MNNKFLKIGLSAFIFLSTATVFNSCKKDEHTPPTVTFKTGGIYTSADAAVGMNDTLTVGVTVAKEEDELNTFNVSYAYDGASSTTTKSNETLPAADEDGFSRDVQIITRNVAGTELWQFTCTDKDGNITTKSITLTVN